MSLCSCYLIYTKIAHVLAILVCPTKRTNFFLCPEGQQTGIQLVLPNGQGLCWNSRAQEWWWIILFRQHPWYKEAPALLFSGVRAAFFSLYLIMANSDLVWNTPHFWSWTIELHQMFLLMSSLKWLFLEFRIWSDWKHPISTWGWALFFLCVYLCGCVMSLHMLYLCVLRVCICAYVVLTCVVSLCMCICCICMCCECVCAYVVLTCAVNLCMCICSIYVCCKFIYVHMLYLHVLWVYVCARVVLTCVVSLFICTCCIYMCCEFASVHMMYLRVLWVYVYWCMFMHDQRTSGAVP